MHRGPFNISDQSLPFDVTSREQKLTNVCLIEMHKVDVTGKGYVQAGKRGHTVRKDLCHV